MIKRESLSLHAGPRIEESMTRRVGVDECKLELAKVSAFSSQSSVYGN